MSSLGDLIRVDVTALAELRADPEAYDRLAEAEPPEKLELDKAWSRLAALLDAAGLPLNPITGGALFPDEQAPWDDAYWLTPAEVTDAAATLARTPFTDLEPHLGAVLAAENWTHVDQDPDSPTFGSPIPVEQSGPVVIPAETLSNIRTVLAARYETLAPFFAEAAAAGQAMVFWAA